MLDLYLASLPVICLIAVGYVLRRADFPGEGFWRPAARLVYFAFLPALLVRLIALAELDASLWRAQAAIAGAVLVLAGALQFLRKHTAADGPAYTSVMQGSIRHNTYIGLAIGAVVLTDDGLASFALLCAVAVPLVNAIAVATLSKYGKGGGAGGGSGAALLRRIVTNPLILACALGAVLNGSGIGLPWQSGEVLRMLAQPALPLGLLVVGAGLDVRALRDVRRELLIPTVLRLAAYPVLVWGLAHALGVASGHLGPLLLLACLPTAASAYVLALELGGDEGLMARIITVETVIASATVPTAMYFVLG